MRKKFTVIVSIIFALVLMISAVVPAFAADSKLLFTDVDSFTAEEQQEVSDYLYEKSEETDCDLVCICISSLDTYKDGEFAQASPEDIAEDYCVANSIGRGADGDAVIAVWVEDDEFGDDSFGVTVFGEKYTEDEVLNSYYEKDYSESDDCYLRCIAFADSFDSLAEDQTYYAETYDDSYVSSYGEDSYEYNYQFNWGKYIIIALVIGAVIGIIIATAMKSSLKSVRKQSGASNYVVADSFKLQRHNDIFLYKKLDKTPKPKQQEPPRK